MARSRPSLQGIDLMSKAVIYGAGGHARELLFQLQAEHGMSSVAAMVDDLVPDRTVHGIEVIDFHRALAWYSRYHWHIAIGDIPIRVRLLAKIRDHGIEAGTFISSRAIVAPSAKILPSSQIFAGSVISDNCEISENVIVNFHCVISHDVKIGANSTIAPRAAIAGNVAVGDNVWIGVGASISNGRAGEPLIIGDRVVVGAGACVVGNIPPDQTVAGVPARAIRGGGNERRTILRSSADCSSM